MTDPIHPWLDATELRQLAESLMQGSPKSRQPAQEDAGFGEAFVGFAAAVTPAASPVSAPIATPAATPPVQAKPMPLAPAPAAPVVVEVASPPIQAIQVAPPAAQVAPPAAQSAPPAAQGAPPPVGGPEQQCLQFQIEMHQQYGCSDLFILNRDGHNVFGKHHLPQLQFIARSLTKHAERRGLPKGHIHIKVGPSQILEIIPVELPNGGWVVGTVVPKPLQPAEIAHWVREISKLGSTLNQL